MTTYASLTSDQQVELLRMVATRGALEFRLEPVDLDLVLHGFNTTFKVTGSDGVPVALRVNTNSFSTLANITVQCAWTRALATDTDVRVPDPLRTFAGADAAVVSGGDQEFIVTAASWLDGDDVGQCATEQAHALGRAMATMHEHAATFVIPEGGELSTFTDPFYGDADHLRPAYTDRSEDLALVEWAWGRCLKAMRDVAESEPSIVIHGDLHGGNLKWHDGSLAVFDFDDCGLGTAILDLAIAVFYLRGEDSTLEGALRAGYAEVRAIPSCEPAVFDAMVAHRQLLLANDLLRTQTPEFKDMQSDYLDTTVSRLSRWRESGSFTR